MSVSRLSGNECWDQLAMSVMSKGWGSGGAHGVLMSGGKGERGGDFENIRTIKKVGKHVIADTFFYAKFIDKFSYRLC